MSKAKLLVPFLLLAATASASSHRPHKPTHHATKAPARHRPARAAGRPHVTKSRHVHAHPVAATPKHHSSRQHSVASKAVTTHHKARRATAHGHTVARHRRPANQPASRSYTVTATVYQAVAGQTDASPFVTADNSRIRPRYGSSMRWLALSPDLLKQGGGKFHYGDKVQVGGVSPQLDGVYTVHDTMNRRHRHRIDILTHRREKLSVFAPGAKLRLAQAPRKSRAQATAAAHARPGRKASKLIASHQLRRSGRQQAG
jgi:3D (Asp-Asp-Asp) domain-containing protein